MKKVTRVLMVVALATFSFNSLAQTFGVQAGLNLANASIKSGGQDVTDGKKMLIGFNVGATAEFDISDVFAFQTGLILNQKGVRFEDSQDFGGITTEVKSKLSVLFLDIPLNAKYKMDLGGNKLYFAAGPYIGIGLTGKSKTEVSAGGQTQENEESIKFGNDAAEHDMKRLDLGLNIGAGMEFGAIGVGIQYGLGFANLTPEGDSDNKTNNRLLSIGVSYKFGQ